MSKDINHLGTYRFDYADGDLNACGRWTPYKGTLETNVVADINFVIKSTLNKFNSLESIQDYCNGIFGTDEKIIPEAIYNSIKYTIKLNPCKGEYNGYIYIYTNKDNG